MDLRFDDIISTQRGQTSERQETKKHIFRGMQSLYGFLSPCPSKSVVTIQLYAFYVPALPKRDGDCGLYSSYQISYTNPAL
jgi:hypothetical protein